MLSPDYYEGCTDDISRLYEQLEDDIISDVVRRIMQTGIVTETAKHQIEQLQESGLLYDDILSEIAKRTDATENHVKAIFEDAGVETVENDNKIYRENGLTPVDIRQSPAMRQTLEAGYRKTLGNMKNLTLTTASTSQTAYINACNSAYMQVASGAFSYQEAIKNAVQRTAQQGATVLYPSGHVERIDVAVRRAVLTGIGQTCREIGIMNAEESGCDLMEISAHSGARPDHAKWQGQIVSLSGKNASRIIDGRRVLSLKDIGYGTGDGFGGWNCRHDWYPFFEGYSKPNYSKKDLEKLDERNIKYNGKMYSQYEISQIQRRYEREIRSAKREQVAFKVAVEEADDPELKQVMQDSLNYSSSLVKDRQAKMRDFIRQTGQNRDYSREQNHKNINLLNNIEQTKNNLTFNSNNDIIKNNNKLFDNDLKIQQIKEYAKNTLGFSIVEYDKINPDFAELINSETSKIYEIFGNLHNAGYLEGVVDYQKRSNFFAAYSPLQKVILMKNVSSLDDIYKMEKTIQKNFKAGFWSSDSKAHIIRHELGHAIQHYLTDNNPEKLQKISKIRNRVMQECNIFDYEISYTEQNIKKAGEFISYYALKSDSELIAESIAEYMNGSPRVTAKEVVDVLLDLD